MQLILVFMTILQNYHTNPGRAFLKKVLACYFTNMKRKLIWQFSPVDKSIRRANSNTEDLEPLPFRNCSIRRKDTLQQNLLNVNFEWVEQNATQELPYLRHSNWHLQYKKYWKCIKKDMHSPFNCLLHFKLRDKSYFMNVLCSQIYKQINELTKV